MFHIRNSSQHEAEFVLLDQPVEEDHLFRRIDQYIDFSSISANIITLKIKKLVEKHKFLYKLRIMNPYKGL